MQLWTHASFEQFTILIGGSEHFCASPNGIPVFNPDKKLRKPIIKMFGIYTIIFLIISYKLT